MNTMTDDTDKHLIQVLSNHATHTPTQNAISFISHDDETTTLTYQRLFEQAQQAASQLSQSYKPGERLVIAMSVSAEYLIVFIACLMAKIIAVPAFWPKTDKTRQRLLAIIDDCQAVGIVLDEAKYNEAQDSFGCCLIDATSLLQYTTETHLEPQNSIDLADIAFLQYTSGSSSHIKGVCVSHQNIISNLEIIKENFVCTTKDIGYIWLPPFHDMGLIGGVLQTLYVGFHTYFISPEQFVRSPIQWLKGISKVKATISGGPSFAFELLNKIAPSRIPKDLDLSSWRIAFCGAEPIAPSTLKTFVETYAPYGFNEDALFPCYGLAEATLYVTGERGALKQHLLTVDKTALSQHQLVPVSPDTANAVTLVSSGKPHDPECLKIVDFESHAPHPEKTIGLIAVSGKSLSPGYWNKSTQGDAAQTSFNTGDCGALVDGRLFVLGRANDLLIVHGRNYHAAMIEQSIPKLDSIIRDNSIAILQNNQGEIITLIEVNKVNDQHTYETLASKIKRQVAKNFSIQINRVYFLKKNSLPKTTSGKLSRFQALHELEQHQLNIIYADTASSSHLPVDSLILEKINQIAEHPIDSLDANIDTTGIDSIGLSTLLAEINQIYPTLHLNIHDLYACEKLIDLKALIEDKLNDPTSALSPETNPVEQLSGYTLPESITPTPSQTKPKSIHHILLTGATGYLGGFILESLIEQTKTEVYCLVRAKDAQMAKSRLLHALESHEIEFAETQWRRIHLVCGDCAYPNFKLSEAEYANLGERIDKVIHCAAEVDFLKSLKTLYPANVLGVEEVIRFACTGKLKEVDQISTYSALLSDDTTPKMKLGYVQSKWLAEKLCLQGIERGIPITLYRIGHVTPHSTRRTANPNDMLGNVLSLCVKSGCLIRAKSALCFQPVDYVSSDLVKLVMSRDKESVINLVNSKGFSLSCIAIMLKCLGYKVSAYPAVEWLKQVKQTVNQDNNPKAFVFMDLFEADPTLLHQFLAFNFKSVKPPDGKHHLKLHSLNLAKQFILLKRYLKGLESFNPSPSGRRCPKGADEGIK